MVYRENYKNWVLTQQIMDITVLIYKTINRWEDISLQFISKTHLSSKLVKILKKITTVHDLNLAYQNQKILSLKQTTSDKLFSTVMNNQDHGTSQSCTFLINSGHQHALLILGEGGVKESSAVCWSAD